MASIQCKTCDIGELVLERKYRMSGVVVAIGYILLIPSVLGILASVSFFLTALSVNTGTQSDGAANAIVGSVSLFFGVLSFVGGLIGWLLVMKKKVLRCAHCSATVAAS